MSRFFLLFSNGLLYLQVITLSINQRIKELRKSLGLNQRDFGARIGLKGGAISKIEQDGNTVVDQNKRIICDKFHISMVATRDR